MWKLNNRPSILSPTLRAKKRYIAFHVISERKILLNDLINAIWQNTLNFLGELGTSQSQLNVVKNLYNENNQTGLIKCSHLHVEQIRASLALIQRIGDSRVLIKTLGVSGTIKAAQAKFFGEKDLASFIKT